MAELLTTALLGLAPPKRGKVREVYDLGDELLIVATDRISAFDAIMANGIPDKGVLLNQMSAFWFEKFAHLSPHHVISTDDEAIAARIGTRFPELAGRATLGKKAKPLPIECVARGYIAGSLFKEYRREGGSVHGLNLPDGLLDGSKLAEPIFTPATKAEEGHDMNISFAQAADLVGREIAELARDRTLAIYQAAAEYALSKGILIADTKFEFGLIDGELVWIDEALTPDSSRFWELDRWAPGGAQFSYDKQFVRDYLEASGWDKNPPGPTLPVEVVTKTREKYVAAYERLTGKSFE